MKKGFTLVELLAVIVILAIIGGIGVVSYTSITKKSEGDYYVNLMDNLKLGGANYFANNRSKRPGINEVCESVNLETLINERYIENANDHKGNTCNLNSSKIYIKRNSNKQYEYKVYLVCNDFNEIFNESEYCTN